MKSKNSLYLPKLANNIKDLVPRIPVSGDISENDDSQESEEIKEQARDFFKSIILDLLSDIVMSENERIVERYNNKMNPFNKKLSLGGRLQN